MIALLGMYDRPETMAAHDRYWGHIRQALGYGPQHLTRNLDFWQAWRSPELVLAQTCGLPFRKTLHDRVTLVGTPDYGVTGCAPGFYRSVLIMRRGAETTLDEISRLRFAFNDRMSQSGWAAFWAHLPSGAAPGALVQTGGHVASARAVAEGRADIAAIDAVTWRLVQRHDTFADQLGVIDMTDPTPGLPYITAPDQPSARIFAAIDQAIAALTPDDRETLCLNGLVRIPAAEYLAIPLPPE